MIIGYQGTNPNASTNYQSYSAYIPYLQTVTDTVTLEDILECCQANGELLKTILEKLNLRGFRRDKPSRKELAAQNQEILNELRTMKRLIRRRDELPGGGYDGPEEKN